MIEQKKPDAKKKKKYTVYLHALLEGVKLIYGDRSDLPGKMGRLTGRNVLGGRICSLHLSLNGGYTDVYKCENGLSCALRIYGFTACN